MRGENLLLAYKPLIASPHVVTLGTGATLLYTCPFPLLTGGKTYVHAIWVTNTHTTGITWDAYFVVSGGSAAQGNAFAWKSPLGVGGWIHESPLDGELVMPGGSSLYALASVNAVVNVMLFGCELAPT